MKRPLGTVLLSTALLALLIPYIAWSQAEAPAVVEEEESLPAEILSAKKIVILNTVMDFSLASAFTSEIMDWERFEVVFSEEDADLCFSLSAQADYRKEEIPTGQSSDEEGVRPRAIGTMRTLDTLYLKVFIPGGDDLWDDEADVGEDSEAAKDLVRRLRQRISNRRNGRRTDSHRGRQSGITRDSRESTGRRPGRPKEGEQGEEITPTNRTHHRVDCRRHLGGSSDRRG